MKMKLIVLAVLTVFIAQPALAHADPDADAAYLKMLHKHDITFQGGDAGLIEFGHQICAQLGEGYSMDAIEEQGKLYVNNTMSDSDVKLVVETAAAAYCPQYIR